jgi:Spy/CpxP family protein refolding chaperone
MRQSIAFLVVITLALAGSAAAQAPGGYGGAGGPGMHGGYHGGMRGSGGMTRLDPVVLEGPPAPAELAGIVQLPENQVTRYAQLYDRFMATTRPQRDSLDTLRAQMRESVGNRDRDAMGRQRSQMEPLAKDLQKQQATFDDTLKSMLDKSQWQRYEKWRDDRRKQADKERQERWQGRGGDQVPPA